MFGSGGLNPGGFGMKAAACCLLAFRPLHGLPGGDGDLFGVYAGFYQVSDPAMPPEFIGLVKTCVGGFAAEISFAGGSPSLDGPILLVFAPVVAALNF